ncbi:hypothetical protein Droror1_Dr00010721 [Drosera rotundifolia]
MEGRAYLLTMARCQTTRLSGKLWKHHGDDSLPSQSEEFAWGLANNKHYFLWIKRPDLVSGEASELPAGFVAETKGSNSEAKREEIEKQVREMMEEEKGREMKNKAMEWKSLAKEAAT